MPSATDAWGGARTGKEATLSNRTVAYSIDAELDPVKHTIDGKQTLAWRNRSARPRVLSKKSRAIAMGAHVWMTRFGMTGHS